MWPAAVGAGWVSLPKTGPLGAAGQAQLTSPQLQGQTLATGQATWCPR